MAGLVSAIHVLLAVIKKGVDARNKCGHDAECAANAGALPLPWGERVAVRGQVTLDRL
jgi:hypothetical protein